jgi:hypothetical protein
MHFEMSVLMDLAVRQSKAKVSSISSLVTTLLLSHGPQVPRADPDEDGAGQVLRVKAGLELP